MHYASVAQLVAQRTLNPWVEGSIPSWGTMNTKEKGKRLSERYKRGELIPVWKGKHLSEETKKKISESMKRSQKEGKAYNIGQSRWNNEHSRSEKWLINVLKNEFNQFENIDYKTEMSFYRYALDFAWPEKRICIEIDGNQHLYDEKQIERDKEKDKLLKEEGWKELRIKWGYIVKNTQDAIKLIGDFINEKGNIIIPLYKSEYEKYMEKRKKNEINGILKDKSGKYCPIKLSEDVWLERKEKILKSGVDLTKYGWNTEVEKITGLTRRIIYRTVERYEDLKNLVYIRKH